MIMNDQHAAGVPWRSVQAHARPQDLRTKVQKECKRLHVNEADFAA